MRVSLVAENGAGNCTKVMHTQNNEQWALDKKNTINKVQVKIFFF